MTPFGCRHLSNKTAEAEHLELAAVPFSNNVEAPVLTGKESDNQEVWVR